MNQDERRANSIGLRVDTGTQIIDISNMEVVPEGSAAQRHQGQQGFSNLLLLLNVDPTVYAIRWGQLRYSTIRKRSFEMCNCLQIQLKEEEFAALLGLYLLD